MNGPAAAAAPDSIGRPSRDHSLRAAIGSEIWMWAKSGTRQWRRIEWAERLGFLSQRNRYRYWLVDRPHYAYGIHRAADGATRLGYEAVTVVELGVAGGNGLLALERHADYLGSQYGIRIDVIGFDSGHGMPRPVDHRDQPYRWGEGYYEMDEVALRSRITSAEVILGDVRTTMQTWIETNREGLRRSPVGFVAFDMDYWSSTVSALNLFRHEDSTHLLPRVVCWLDDIVFSIPTIGELQALAEFNSEAPDKRSIGPIVGLRAGIPFDPPWADQLFEAHQFRHPRYSDRVESAPAQLPLKRTA
jgi:hypothetical protein